MNAKFPAIHNSRDYVFCQHAVKVYETGFLTRFCFPL